MGGASSLLLRRKAMLDRQTLIDKKFILDGDMWRIVGVGTVRDGKVYLHLASTTRFRQQRNGPNPIQMADWIPVDLIQDQPF